MKIQNTLLTPPWDMETAAKRLQLLEDDFNSLETEKMSMNFTEDAEVRFGLEFLKGRQEIKDFFVTEWQTKNTYKISFELWGALKGRMAVLSVLDWIDINGHASKNYGVQVFQFDDNGLIQVNYLSFNDQLDSIDRQ